LEIFSFPALDIDLSAQDRGEIPVTSEIFTSSSSPGRRSPVLICDM